VREYLLAKERHLCSVAEGLICAPQQSGSPPAAFLDVSSLNLAAPKGAALFSAGASGRSVRNGASPPAIAALGRPGEDFRKRGVDAGSNWRHKPPPAERWSCLTRPARDANGVDGLAVS
jgi:hypothetical protein